MNEITSIVGTHLGNISHGHNHPEATGKFFIRAHNVI